MLVGARVRAGAASTNHAGAIHLYIHAVEASPDPGRAERYADRLAALVPGAGHIVHMPAHIYLRTGRFDDASQANEDAIKADEAYFAGDVGGGQHDVPGRLRTRTTSTSSATSAAFEGRRADALKAAEDVRAKMHADMMRDPAMGGMVQHFALTPPFTNVRFGRWDAGPRRAGAGGDSSLPARDPHAARGLAHAARGRLKEAEAELAAATARKE